MENILKALIEGASQQPTGRPAPAAVDPLSEILGGILGGSAGPSRAPMPSQAGGNPLGGILEGILGGGGGSGFTPPSSQGGGGIMDILGSVMGGKSARTNNPIANLLAEKLGISPVIANMIVSYFMAKLLSGKVGHMIPNNAGGGISARPVQTKQSDGLDLDDLFDVMGGDGTAVRTHLSNSTMPQELAQYANIDEQTATQGLAELVKIIGGQRRHPQPVTPQKADLKGLLDAWDVD